MDNVQALALGLKLHKVLLYKSVALQSTKLANIVDQ